jgi:hypothetical protein
MRMYVSVLSDDYDSIYKYTYWKQLFSKLSFYAQIEVVANVTSQQAVPILLLTGASP